LLLIAIGTYVAASSSLCLTLTSRDTRAGARGVHGQRRPGRQPCWAWQPPCVLRERVACLLVRLPVRGREEAGKRKGAMRNKRGLARAWAWSTGLGRPVPLCVRVLWRAPHAQTSSAPYFLGGGETAWGARPCCPSAQPDNALRSPQRLHMALRRVPRLVNALS
jgi:hypothetical protein